MIKDRKALKLALEALENLKEVVAAAQVLGIKAGATGKDMRVGESFLHDDAIAAIKEALAQPERDWIDLKGKEKELIASVSLDVHDAVHRTNAKLKELNK